MRKRNYDMAHLPTEIQWLILMSWYKWPIGMSHYQRIKKEYPKYWNFAREFDPFFEDRNPFINIPKRFWQWIKWKWYLIAGRRISMYKFKRKVKAGTAKGILERIREMDTGQ